MKDQFSEQLAPYMKTIDPARLNYYWRQALAQGHTASIFILSSNTVAFIPTTQGGFLLDSHLHGNSGVHVTFASWQHSFELLSWFKEIKITFNKLLEQSPM